MITVFGHSGGIMSRLVVMLAGMLALTASACSSGPTRLEGVYTCTNGTQLRFSADGIVTYRAQAKPAREYPYFADGEAVRLLRDEERDPVGDNVRHEYARDGDRLVFVRGGGPDERLVCEEGTEQPAMAVPQPKPTAAFVERERSGTQLAEVLGLRLGDSLADVRGKLGANANPFSELAVTLVSENPDVFEEIQFAPAPKPGNSTSDSLVAYFSPPPQRLIGIERHWMDAKNPIRWESIQTPAIDRYGQPVELDGARADAWFVNSRGQPIEPPPFAKSNANGLESAVYQTAEKPVQCGRMLQMNSLDRASGVVTDFTASLYDAGAIAAARRGWANAAQQEIDRQRNAQLDAAKVPEM